MKHIKELIMSIVKLLKGEDNVRNFRQSTIFVEDLLSVLREDLLSNLSEELLVLHLTTAPSHEKR